MCLSRWDMSGKRNGIINTLFIVIDEIWKKKSEQFNRECVVARVIMLAVLQSITTLDFPKMSIERATQTRMRVRNVSLFHCADLDTSYNYILEVDINTDIKFWFEIHAHDICSCTYTTSVSKVLKWTVAWLWPNRVLFKPQGEGKQVLPLRRALLKVTSGSSKLPLTRHVVTY